MAVRVALRAAAALTLRVLTGGQQGRHLTCTKCGVTWRVFELPREFIDPTTFDCLQCGTLSLLELADLERIQERRYDPSISLFPEGY